MLSLVEDIVSDVKFHWISSTHTPYIDHVVYSGNHLLQCGLNLFKNQHNEPERPGKKPWSNLNSSDLWEFTFSLMIGWIVINELAFINKLYWLPISTICKFLPFFRIQYPGWNVGEQRLVIELVFWLMQRNQEYPNSSYNRPF